ncbi:hypothetical protein MKW98_012986 [Papaver atlanticum]|uniref:Uncharacterized protein n=1 Tax=Papaver atlanticum TaxID=357466 RepID=A0AAD4SJ19_9MAGN|nr:hypothetical protein MKW98_012986 [Papaver atlanticum]
MESSEEEDDFPTHEWITPQSKINSIYQSNAEKTCMKESDHFGLCTFQFGLPRLAQNHISARFWNLDTYSPQIKGIRKLCCELLDLKDAVENLCGNMHTKYQAFLG